MESVKLYSATPIVGVALVTDMNGQPDREIDFLFKVS